jgi:HEAT repeat protein
MVTDMIMALRHADLQIRKSAAIELGEAGDTSAVEPLLEALTSSLGSDVDPIAHFKVAAEIIKALGKIGDPRAVIPLGCIVFGSAPFTKHLNSYMRLVERKALTEAVFSKPIASALTGKIEGQLEGFGKFFEEFDDLRALSAIALGEIKDPKAVFPLVVMASAKTSFNLWTSCQEAIIKIGKTAVPELIRLLDERLSKKDSTKDGIAITSVRILGKLESPEAVPYIVHAIGSRDYELKMAAVSSLQEVLRGTGGSIKDTEFEFLVDSLKRGDLAAARALGVIKDVRAIEPLILATSNWLTREEATEALKNIGHPAIGPLTNALNHKKRVIRKQAAKILSSMS